MLSCLAAPGIDGVYMPGFPGKVEEVGPTGHQGFPGLDGLNSILGLPGRWNFGNC